MTDYVKQDDGTLGDSPEQVAGRVQRYLQRLGLGFEAGIATLSSTPLDGIIAGGYTALVTYKASDTLETPSPMFCFYSHLRTALVHESLKSHGHHGPWVIVRDPIMLMNDLMDDTQGPKLMQCDVLVILATAFPYYAAAQQHIGNLLRMRQGLSKCSIFAKPSTYELLKRPEKATDPEFVAFMDDENYVSNILIKEDDLPSLVKRTNGADLPWFEAPKPKKKR